MVPAPGRRVVVFHRPTGSEVSDRRPQILELVAGDHVTPGIGHAQAVEMDTSGLVGVLVVERVRVHYPQGFGPGGQRHRPDQRLPVLPEFRLDGLGGVGCGKVWNDTLSARGPLPLPADPAFESTNIRSLS